MVIESLAEAVPEEMEEVFSEETAHWQSQLYWDYLPALKLIRRLIASRTLPGLTVRTEDRRVVGYSYYIVDRSVGFIGNLFIRDRYASPSLYRSLVAKTIDSLRRWNRIERVECQIFPFNCDLAEIFKGQGFRAIRRFFLVRALDGHLWQQTAKPADSAFVWKWDSSYLVAAAGVVYDSYRQSPDADLCRDYQSPEGCIRFFRNLIDNPACGIFNPHTSRIAVNSKGQLCGVLLTSNISSETGMIPQISIRRQCQGQGLGTRLLQSYFEAAQNAGLKRIALSVSEVNHKAFRLYQRLGFELGKEFYAYLWPA